MKHPTLRNLESRLMLSQAAANFFAKLIFEADAADPPYHPYPFPKLEMEPLALPAAEFGKVAEAAVARQKKFVVKRTYPLLAQLCSALMRLSVPGEVARAWGSFGEIGAQWANLAQIASATLIQNQETSDSRGTRRTRRTRRTDTGSAGRGVATAGARSSRPHKRGPPTFGAIAAETHARRCRAA